MRIKGISLGKRRMETSCGCDLHCHLLPDMDDGAKDLETAVRMIGEEERNGISSIIVTPHYCADQEPVESFLARRRHAFDRILQQADPLPLPVKLGAEVKICRALSETALEGLMLGGSRYLLLEWPFQVFPLWAEDMLETLMSNGIVPIFAHVERYDYLAGNPDYLSEWVEKGALCQINASSLISPDRRRTVLRLLQNQLVHFIASDAHNLTSRAPNVKEAYEVVLRWLGEKTVGRLVENSLCVFQDREICP